MNRKLLVGIAVFFIVIGISLMGGQTAAVAGHGCHGCSGGYGCDGGGWCDGGGCGGGGCHGGFVHDTGYGCHGGGWCDGGGCHGRRRGLLHRIHHRRAMRHAHCGGGGCWGGGGCHGGYVSVGYGCSGY